MTAIRAGIHDPMRWDEARCTVQVGDGGSVGRMSRDCLGVPSTVQGTSRDRVRRCGLRQGYTTASSGA